MAGKNSLCVIFGLFIFGDYIGDGVGGREGVHVTQGKGIWANRRASMSTLRFVSSSVEVGGAK